MEAANIVPCFQVRYTNLAYRHFTEMTNYSTFFKTFVEIKKKIDTVEQPTPFLFSKDISLNDEPDKQKCIKHIKETWMYFLGTLKLTREIPGLKRKQPFRQWYVHSKYATVNQKNLRT